MPTKRTIEISEAEKERLREARDHASKPYVRERCAAILKIARGASAHWVAKHGLLKKRNPDTIYNWMDYYEVAGIDGLRRHQQGGYRRGRL